MKQSQPCVQHSHHESHNWLWQNSVCLQGNRSYIIPTFMQLIVKNKMFTDISPLSYSTICCCILSSCSCFLSHHCSPKSGWPTCCTQVGQRRGHWPAGLSLGLRWQISSCPVPGLDWSKSFHWCILLKTDIYISSMLCVYSELYK